MSQSTDDCELSQSKPYKAAKPLGLLYTVDETPPWYLCIFLGFQHYLTMFGSTVAIPLLVTPSLCIGDDYVGLSNIINSMFFISGLVTLLQCTLGSRLPIVQGSTASFVAPTLALMALPQWQCPVAHDTTWNNSDSLNNTENEVIWKSRMREVQGAILLASLFQIVLGLSGLIGIALRFIGPLPIACTIALVGLSLFRAVADFCSHQWWVALMTIVLMTLFSQYLRNINIPIAIYKRRGIGQKGCIKIDFPVFKLFPVILSILVAWLICGILTATDALPDAEDEWGYHARTDTRLVVLRDTPWFRFPYPFQWGWPTFSLSGVLGMLAASIAGMMESIGDYYACARMSGAPPPPVHAVNRGIFVEGIGCALAGIWGTGSATTSYGENIGAIGITKVGSRRVVQTGAALMLILGMIGKFGAVFVTIPQPIMGGVFMVMFGMVVSVGVANLQHVDMNSSRNLFIFGFSIFFGLSLPYWMTNNGDDIQTGVSTLNQIFKVLLQTSMFVGGTVAFILDSTIPGTVEERGLKKWRDQYGSVTVHQVSTYDFPVGMRLIRKWQWTRYFPLSPTFQEKSRSPTGDDNGISESRL